MQNERENNIDNTAEQAGGVRREPNVPCDGATEQGAVARDSGTAKKRLPLIRSMSARMAVDYCLFAIIILVLFLVVFFSCLYVFYGGMMENETDRIERSASAGFPKRVGDNSFMLYKYRLFQVARDNKPVAIAVFEIGDSGNIEVRIVVDDMGNGTSNNSELFDSVIAKLNFSDVLERGRIAKVGTPFGTYMCKGSKHVTEDGITAYLLVMNPYDMWNQQTTKIVYLLAICTAIVMVLACIYAIFESRHKTKHLKDFSQKAKRVADGDYNVVFSGYGYDEYENLACALNAATQNIQKAENLQRDIIANVSHDIRTPLTMIRAYAEMLRDMPMREDKRKKTADVIITEADRLTMLVSDVLNYSKLESGVSDYKLESCDLAHIASEVLDRFDIVRDRDGIKLLRDFDDEAIVTCDEQKIEQVFYNLVGNAVNYCGEDKTVILRVKKKTDCVRVEVEDHGSGIDENDLDSVWDRYYRSAHSTRTVVGSGLGLSICKTVLTAHNANFGVVSEIGKGSTFWFELK